MPPVRQIVLLLVASIASANGDEDPIEPELAKGTCLSLKEEFRRLNEHLDQNTNSLRSENWAKSRNMEHQIAAIKAAVDHVRTHSERMRRNNQQLPTPSGPKSELERQMQVVIASLRLLSSDLDSIKQNLSSISQTSNEIKTQLEVGSAINAVFSGPQSAAVPSSCLDIKKSNPTATSSVYLIQNKETKTPFYAYCNMEYQGGGWMAIQNRFTGEQDFYRDWQDYRVGFGNIAGEHWLGLERVHQLTGSEIHELLIELVDVNNAKTHARYSHFSLGSELEGYAMKVLGSFKGDAGDSLSYHAGMKFSTRDKDQDSWTEGSCAQTHGGAWWYKSCDRSNLNGRYLPGEQPEQFMYQPMYWETIGGPKTGLLVSRMFIRPRQ
ncbi:microfibril-associated glycoprotein 4 [Dendroctonus ponderosae]|uniref:Fibrinogen C-terminal domain-containing protein n=1 Tax=Dendroctonus ponderosae TaxID=77166 RepID=A0AAR5PZ79_DENPD|nr:microfibril-associated glycoprotein 4 [Dendroctonus ponderosae]